MDSDPNLPNGLHAGTSEYTREMWDSLTDDQRFLAFRMASRLWSDTHRPGCSCPIDHEPDCPRYTIKREPEYVCNRCRAPKGEHALGEACNNNCGGQVVRRGSVEDNERESFGPDVCFRCEGSGCLNCLDTVRTPRTISLIIWQAILDSAAHDPRLAVTGALRNAADKAAERIVREFGPLIPVERSRYVAEPFGYGGKWLVRDTLTCPEEGGIVVQVFHPRGDVCPPGLSPQEYGDPRSAAQAEAARRNASVTDLTHDTDESS